MPTFFALLKKKIIHPKIRNLFLRNPLEFSIILECFFPYVSLFFVASREDVKEKHLTLEKIGIPA